MDVRQAIRARRSIRKFIRKDIPTDDLEELLEMARLAPSGANRQPWEMVVVTDRKRITELVPLCKNQKFIEDCSAFLVGIDDPQQKWAKVDVTIALDHVSLAATDMGLGTCWIGAFDQERLAEFLNVPKTKVITVCMAIGYPAENPEPRSRKEHDDLFFYQKYRGA
ncbi:MAG: nitroreductase family protein [Methanomassiliicoccales archaeon]|nr:MAG: nitroreductase family protein [Methanomassiliicoccales archaeon]